MKIILSALALMVCVATRAAAEAPDWEGQRAAFFGLTFIDTSSEGEIRGIRADETARVALTEAYVRETLRAEGITLVDLAPVSDELARTLNPASCNDCDLRMADALDVRYAISGEVQKVSNLIIAMNLYIRDTETGAYLRGQSVDVRGNTDDSWLRGMRYILTRNIFADED